MIKKNAPRTQLPRLEGHRATVLGADELRRTVGALPRTRSTGACTLNCDDWSDCD